MVGHARFAVLVAGPKRTGRSKPNYPSTPSPRYSRGYPYRNQNLTLSLFVYVSPSDQDTYLRPIARYKLTDDWLLVGGGNLFYGKYDHTFFGQFENNNSLYAAVRYSF